MYNYNYKYFADRKVLIVDVLAIPCRAMYSRKASRWTLAKEWSFCRVNAVYIATLQEGMSCWTAVGKLKLVILVYPHMWTGKGHSFGR
jgi:hypothetical protein